MKTMHKLVRVLRDDPRPLRRIASRALIRMPFNPARFVRVRVHDYQIYLHRSTLAAEFWYDANARRDDDAFLRAYLAPNDVYVDVGANIGTTVIPAARIITEGRVVAFEPHPRIYSFLQENLRLNGISHVEARNCALGAQAGWTRFTDDLTDDQNHPDDERGSLQVQVEMLDRFTHDVDRVALLKIDVEGYEKHVVDGGPATLDKTECIYFELSEVHAQRFGNHNSDLLATLEGHGLRLFRKSGPGQLEALQRDYRQTVHHENAFAIRDVNAFQKRTGWEITAA